MASPALASLLAAVLADRSRPDDMNVAAPRCLDARLAALAQSEWQEWVGLRRSQIQGPGWALMLSVTMKV